MILEAVRLVDLKARMSNAGFVVGADQRELENRTILCGTQPRNLGCRWRGSILEAVHLGDLDDRAKRVSNDSLVGGAYQREPCPCADSDFLDRRHRVDPGAL